MKGTGSARESANCGLASGEQAAKIGVLAMKTTSRTRIRISTGLVALLCAALGGCSKKSADTEPAPEPPPLVVATPPPATPVPATPAPATPAPVAKRLAPAGTYFLLVKKSIETSDGIIGFKPGTQVKQESDGSFTVEGRKLDVRANEVTNDLDLAARYAGADAQRQAVLRQTAALAAATPPPASASTPQPASRPAGPSVAAGRRSAAAIESSSALGASHTRTKDGWVWQKDARGNWTRVKPVR